MCGICKQFVAIIVQRAQLIATILQQQQQRGTLAAIETLLLAMYAMQLLGIQLTSLYGINRCISSIPAQIACSAEAAHNKIAYSTELSFRICIQWIYNNNMSLHISSKQSDLCLDLVYIALCLHGLQTYTVASARSTLRFSYQQITCSKEAKKKQKKAQLLASIHRHDRTSALRQTTTELLSSVAIMMFSHIPRGTLLRFRMNILHATCTTGTV